MRLRWTSIYQGESVMDTKEESNLFKVEPANKPGRIVRDGPKRQKQRQGQ